MASLPQPVPSYAIASTAALALLFALSILLAARARSSTRSFEEYIAGRRNIGPVVTGCALSASWLSGWATLGMMGITYTFGWSGIWFAGVWTIMGIMTALYVAGPKITEFVAEHNVRTVPEIVGARFSSKGLQSLAAVVMIIFLLMYSVGQFKAGATAWYAVTGLPPIYCLLLTALICITYIVLGGYTGTQWALALQGAFIGLACLALGLSALSYVGGPLGLNAKLAEESPALLQLVRTDLPSVGKLELFTSWVGISATLPLFIAMALGFPHNIARFLGARKMTKRDYSLAALTVFLIAGPPIFLNAITGLAARAAFGPSLLKIVPWKGDLAAPYIAMVSGGEPLTALYLAGLFAASLSTLSAMVITMASSVARDLVQIWRPETPSTKLVNLVKISTIVFVLIPLYWTLVRPPELLAIFMGYAAIGLGGAFLPAAVISLYWRRATKAGAAASLLYSFIATIALGMLVQTKAVGMGVMIYSVIGGSLAIYTIVSLLTAKPRALEA
ncbi:MAG: hypothetical protein J7L98_05430 [Candidatus Verstraetearchaeota archaeon]|nr:hypothetical protein [Candidatus Verstraetearchaeota archaeon]